MNGNTPSPNRKSTEFSPTLAKSENGNDSLFTNRSVSEQQTSNGAFLAASGGATTGSPSHSGFRKKVTPEANATSSLDKLLYPRVTGRPDFAPYRVVLGHVREKVHFAYLNEQKVHFC